MQEAQTAMKMLVLLVQAFAEAFSEKKRQRNLLDFSDMEQFALRILTEEKEGKLFRQQWHRSIRNALKKL